MAGRTGRALVDLRDASAAPERDQRSEVEERTEEFSHASQASQQLFYSDLNVDKEETVGWQILVSCLKAEGYHRWPLLFEYG